jgi:hypothetical protein
MFLRKVLVRRQFDTRDLVSNCTRGTNVATKINSPRFSSKDVVLVSLLPYRNSRKKSIPNKFIIRVANANSREDNINMDVAATSGVINTH